MSAAKVVFTCLGFCIGLLGSAVSPAEELDSSIASCLKAWGKHPFGPKPKYRTLATSVKVFGIGQATTDTETTNTPSLVLVNPGVNVMGGSTVKLLNPNGWYCLRSNVNVMVGLHIQAHCKTHLASAYDGVTVLGSSPSGQRVTGRGRAKVGLCGGG